MFYSFFSATTQTIIESLVKIEPNSSRTDRQKDRYLINYNKVWFYGVSIIVGYLMPNTFLYNSILNNSVQNKYSV